MHKILEKLSLHYWNRKSIIISQDSGAHTTAALFKLLNKKQKPVILLGPSSTKGLEPVAEVAPLWDLVQVWFFSLLFYNSSEVNCEK